MGANWNSNGTFSQPHNLRPRKYNLRLAKNMQFDWNLLRPESEPSDRQRSLAHEIAGTYLITGLGISDHQKKGELGKDRHLLGELIQLGLIRSDGNRFYPTFQGLYHVDSQLRDKCAEALDLILKSIKTLYVSAPGRYSFQQINDQIMESVTVHTATSKQLVAPADMLHTYIPRALIFLLDFRQFVNVLQSNFPDVSGFSVMGTDTMFDYENLQQAWKYEAEQRPKLVRANPTASEQAGPKPPAISNEPGKKVFVIHGRDERLRKGMFDFLRALHLEPLEWTKAIQLTGKPSPYIGEILDAAFNHAQAAVVLLSPDDEAKLRADLLQADDSPSEKVLTGQARPNVLFEAGMAFGSHENQTVLVQFGQVRPFSDIAGRHIVKMDNSVAKRQELGLKLKTAGCSVDMDGTDWHTTGDLRAPNENPGTSSKEIAFPIGISGSAIWQPSAALQCQTVNSEIRNELILKDSKLFELMSVELLAPSGAKLADIKISTETLSTGFRVHIPHAEIVKLTNRNYKSGLIRYNVRRGDDPYIGTIPFEAEAVFIANTQWIRLVG
jgi:predicted nucleotide-binding protein